MKNKKTLPLLGKILQKLAPQIGAKVVIEPDWQIAGQIIFKNGRKRYFRYSSLDLNPLGATEIAKDKDYANFFMKKMGYPTIPGRAFFSPAWSRAIKSSRNIEAAYRYAGRIGWPVMVKPNSGSQGRGVAKVRGRQEFYRALRTIFSEDRVALVQPVIEGQDYRLVVLDGRVISAYRRTPFSVVGDGISSLDKLIKNKLRLFHVLERPATIKSDDSRLANNLKKQGLTGRSIPARGEKIFLLDNANLSCGGDSADVTDEIHSGFKKIAIQLTKDMGLRLSGVDLMIDGEIAAAPKKYRVIEINAAPGLDHYVRTGRAQEKIVEKMYLQILKALEKEVR